MQTYPPFGSVIGEGRVGDEGTGSQSAQGASTLQGAHDPLNGFGPCTSQGEILRAELAEEISEFHALNLQAILAMAEGSEFASDYLEMAEAVAGSPYERVLITESRTAYDLLQSAPLTAVRRYLAALEHTCQTEGPWKSLLIALCSAADAETIKAVLRVFARLHDGLTSRLVESLSSRAVIREVRARLALRALLERHWRTRTPAAAGAKLSA